MMSSDKDKQEFRYGYEYEVTARVGGCSSEREAANSVKDDFPGSKVNHRMEQGDPEDGVIRLTFRDTVKVEAVPDRARSEAENEVTSIIPGGTEITDLSER